MVMVPERATPVLAAAVTLTVPSPLPFAPDAMVSQSVALEAVHAQPAPAVTLTFDDPPAAGIVRLAGANPNEQPLPWVTVKVWPAIMSAAERGPPVVAAALYATVPLPLPLAPEVIVSHAALLVAVQAHPAALVTGTLPVPPPAGTLAVVAASENAQPLPWVR